MAAVDGLASAPELLKYLDEAFPSALDLAVTELVSQFAAASPDARRYSGTRLNNRQSIALEQFARRAAQAAVRRDDPTLIREGLRALVVQVGYPDPRELWRSVAPLYRAAEILRVDVDSLFRDAADFAASDTSEFVATFPRRTAEDRRLEKWQFREEGVGDSFRFVSTAPTIMDSAVEPLRRLMERTNRGAM